MFPTSLCSDQRGTHISISFGILIQLESIIITREMTSVARLFGTISALRKQSQTKVQCEARFQASSGSKRSTSHTRVDVLSVEKCSVTCHTFPMNVEVQLDLSKKKKKSNYNIWWTNPHGSALA